ncbi:hypothetical protein NUW54_g3006 [Trametes sanguinea]|uniref:Uncharacterized protein n=1 Tax=Trametes sanguinea TaxID=158606 RepID=A0ACC1Q2K8_9APHY|nr:hypothetical protein NUW54_g3006 [Trametes sanguinea]
MFAAGLPHRRYLSAKPAIVELPRQNLGHRIWRRLINDTAADIEPNVDHPPRITCQGVQVFLMRREKSRHLRETEATANSAEHRVRRQSLNQRRTSTARYFMYQTLHGAIAVAAKTKTTSRENISDWTRTGRLSNAAPREPPVFRVNTGLALCPPMPRDIDPPSTSIQ